MTHGGGVVGEEHRLFTGGSVGLIQKGNGEFGEEGVETLLGTA